MNTVLSRNIQIGGVTIQESRTVVSDGAAVQTPIVQPGKVSTLTVRTDNATGSITGPNGHGITTAQLVDLYFVGGVRRGVTVGTVAVNVIPFSGGTGDNLPASGQPITISARTQMTLQVTGNQAQSIAFGCAGARMSISLKESGATEIYNRTLPAGGSYTWFNGEGTTNPLANYTIVAAFVSHDGGTTGTTAYPVTLGIGYNNP